MKNGKNKILGVSLAALAAVGGTMLLGKKIKKDKEKRLIENETFSTGRVRQLGTLYLNDVKQKIPSNIEGSEDIASFNGENIEIKNTDKNDENKISWVEVNEDGKKLLICTRNILKNISWSELNDQNLAYGKVIVIDGKKYLLRLLTGSTIEIGQKFSEWDKYILNAESDENLPEATDDDKNNTIKEDNDEKVSGLNNSIWHWCNCCSFTQSEYGKNNKFCIIRGFYSAIYCNYCDKGIRYETVGYRPVLEVIE